MTWEWKIGDPVDDANGGTMDAMNWGHGSNEDDGDYNRGSNSGYGGYGGYRRNVSPEEMNRRSLEGKKRSYEHKLEYARSQTNDEIRIRYYCEALEYAEQYYEESERLGITVEGMPDRNHLLSKDDVDWISKKHYDEFYKVRLLSTDPKENLEKLLRQSGNGHRIIKNKEIRRQKSEENARRIRIERTRDLKRGYFEHIEKANDYVLKNKSGTAIREYKNAISDYESFFQSEYAKGEMKRGMPERSLSEDDVDNIMTIYVNYHPPLRPCKANEKLNGEIIDLLDGKWDERLREADIEVGKLLEEKNLERQKRKEKVEDIAVDVIVGARIVGDSILKRFRK